MRVKLPVAVDRELDQWFFDHMNIPAPEDLRKQLSVAIASVKKSAMQDGWRQQNRRGGAL